MNARKHNKSDWFFRLVFCLVLLVFLFSMNAFCLKGINNKPRYRTGNESIECVKNLSVNREFVKLNDFKTVFPCWQSVFNDCRGAYKNIYIDGAKIYRNKLDYCKNEIIKKRLLDSLMFIYEKRITFFADIADLLGGQGIDMLHYSGNKGGNLKNVCKLFKIGIKYFSTSETTFF
jgi:hypothetical protein